VSFREETAQKIFKTQKNAKVRLAMLLALAGGLRRGEIDSMTWPQIDFERALIRVEATESARLKTADSRGEVPIDLGVVSILRGFRANASGPFVIEAEGGEYGPRVWGQHYRADAVFTRLNHWLRKHGVTARKPLHELRKELGSLVTAEHGIYAASRVLRHSTVATTAAHYADLKTRPAIAVSAWLKPENVLPMSDAQGNTNQTTRRSRTGQRVKSKGIY
jgi:integrase